MSTIGGFITSVVCLGTSFNHTTWLSGLYVEVLEKTVLPMPVKPFYRGPNSILALPPLVIRFSRRIKFVKDE